MSGLSEVEQWVGDNWTFECGEDINVVFEQIDNDWNPEQRFGLVQILGNELPDFMVWLQEQIDDECEDVTEQITFPPERAKRNEDRENEILDTEIELLETRKELLELRIAEIEERKGGVFEGIKRFIRNIFRG